MDRGEAINIISKVRRFILDTKPIINDYDSIENKEPVMAAILRDIDGFYKGVRDFKRAVDYFLSAYGYDKPVHAAITEIGEIAREIHFGGAFKSVRDFDNRTPEAVLFRIVCGISANVRHYLKFAFVSDAASSVEGIGTPTSSDAASSVEGIGTPTSSDAASSVEGTGTPTSSDAASSVEDADRKKAQSDNPLLANKKFRSVLKELIKSEICDENYDWKGTKSLFACFAGHVSRKMELSVREQSGEKCVSWEPFLALFTIGGKEIRNISQAWQHVKDEYSKPKGWDKIDGIISKIFR